MINLSNCYWSILGNASQVWGSAENALVSCTNAAYVAWLASGNFASVAPSASAAIIAVITGKDLLNDSDTTMHRIAEAVALGQTTMTAVDVVAWVDWRRALRAIVSGADTTSTAIPIRPAYPSGT